MAPLPGNEFWKARSSHGRDLIFKNSDILREACEEYFQWVNDNPLYEGKVFSHMGKIISGEVPKMRAMTIDGLCNFLDIQVQTWTNYSKREDFLGVTTRVEQIIRDQKFTGAAADLLNANIIARDLGLKDSTSSELKVTLEGRTDEELDADIAKLTNKE